MCVCVFVGNALSVHIGSDVACFNLFSTLLVRHDEPMLFQSLRAPQHPQACQLPDPHKAPSRRLGHTLARKAAEKACAHWEAHNKKACIHDVLATGGTAAAACKLVEQLGGEVVQCNFLLELSSLEGRQKLNGYPMSSLLVY